MLKRAESGDRKRRSNSETGDGGRVGGGGYPTIPPGLVGRTNSVLYVNNTLAPGIHPGIIAGADVIHALTAAQRRDVEMP